jgi:hypothetical protein
MKRMPKITMTPALNAALIRWRDASVACRELDVHFNPRTKAGKPLAARAEAAFAEFRAARDAVLALIDPEDDQ